MKIKIYTTAQSRFFTDDLPFIEKCLKQSGGRGPVTFDVESISPPTTVPTVRDRDGDVRIVWDWFNKRFTEPEYDCVAFHFTTYYKKKWGLSKRIKGSFHTNSDPFEFWLCADKDEQARNYDFSEFARIFIHEMGHADSQKTSVKDRTHEYDYNQHAIHTLHKTLSYRNWYIQKRIISLLTRIISIYEEIVSSKTH